MRTERAYATTCVALAAAVGFSMVANPLSAQENPADHPNPPVAAQCDLSVTPQVLTLPSQPAEQAEEQRRQQRVAAQRTVTVTAEDETSEFRDVRIEMASGIELGEMKKKAEKPEKPETEDRPAQPEEEQKKAKQFTVDMDLSDAKPGEWTMTFVRQDQKECLATVVVEDPSGGGALH